MNFEDSFYDYSKDNFYEYFSRIQYMLQTSNLGYKETLLEKDKLLESNPKIEEIFYGRKAMDLTLADCKDIIKFIELQEKIKEFEDEALFLLGGREVYLYFKKLDLLKD